MLKTNQTETFTASAMMSSGPSQTVQPAWTSDNTTVLSIDVTGLARGLTNGAATITATHGGVSETRRMRVVTDYQGSWTGDYVVRRCDHTGDFRSGEFCDREEGFWAGDRLPIALTLTQERDAVTGPFTLGGIAGTLAGTVDGSGQLTATAGLTLTVDWERRHVQRAQFCGTCRRRTPERRLYRRCHRCEPLREGSSRGRAAKCHASRGRYGPRRRRRFELIRQLARAAPGDQATPIEASHGGGAPARKCRRTICHVFTSRTWRVTLPDRVRARAH